MLTKAEIARREPANLPTVEYPPEVMERWRKEAEIARQQIATGELKPMSVAEFAAEYGIVIDDCEMEEDDGW